MVSVSVSVLLVPCREPKLVVLDEPVRTGRVRPGWCDQPAGGAACKPGPELPDGCSRPRGDSPRIRPRCGDVPGSIVEIGDVDQVFDNPIHPYTRALLSAIPVPDPEVE